MRRRLVYDPPVTAVTPGTKLPAHAARWDALVWPRWLPVQARLPLIAQITGAVALTALVTAPWWSAIPKPRTPAAARSDAVAPPAIAAIPVSSAAVPAATTGATAAPVRPAHLNLDVRHSFASVDFSVSVDGKPAFATRLAGSGKRFKIFGKRSERGYTRTIDLPPGVRVVRVRVRSAEEAFDQTRVERFDLGPASVATLRVSVDESGLSLVAERPPSPRAVPVQPVQATALPSVVVPAAAPAVPASAPGAPPAVREASAVVDLLQSMRSILIAIAGFVASAATAVVIEDYLRMRRQRFQAAGAADHEIPYTSRRRRPGRARIRRENGKTGDNGGEIGTAGDSGVRGTDHSSLASE